MFVFGRLHIGNTFVENIKLFPRRNPGTVLRLSSQGAPLLDDGALDIFVTCARHLPHSRYIPCK